MGRPDPYPARWRGLVVLVVPGATDGVRQTVIDRHGRPLSVPADDLDPPAATAVVIEQWQAEIARRMAAEIPAHLLDHQERA